MDDYERIVNKISQLIGSSGFDLPNNQGMAKHFPDFLQQLLDGYLSLYKDELHAEVDQNVLFDSKDSNVVYSKIEKLRDDILATVDLYYAGKINEASNLFFQSLDDLLISKLGYVGTIEKGSIFYRARTNNGAIFNRADIFHIDFKYRHIVSTNRYSIPGLPALYLGDSTYVCWEEFNRHRLRDLWFSKFENQNELKVFQIQRPKDFLSDLSEMDIVNVAKTTLLLRYLVTFPLSLSCTVRVMNSNANFKPEYIIPQLLLEYASRGEEISGVKFPSSKVDYGRLDRIKSYNYVFPVKSNMKEGFCQVLKSNFHLTNPTSLELEEILHNPTFPPIMMGDGRPANSPSIKFIEERSHAYEDTSFGKLEDSLKWLKLDTV